MRQGCGRGRATIGFLVKRLPWIREVDTLRPTNTDIDASWNPLRGRRTGEAFVEAGHQAREGYIGLMVLGEEYSWNAASALGIRKRLRHHVGRRSAR
jgi:hypothetical protein